MSHQDLAEASLDRIMRAAFRGRIVIPAYNIAHFPMLGPIIDTLAELRCFSLVEVARPDVEKFGAKSFSAVAAEYRRIGNRAVSRLHLDHVPVIDEDGREVDWQALINGALDDGYDSVMIDGSRLPLDENIRVTAAVVRRARAAGRPVEAELGAVLGHETGPLPPYEELYRTGRGFTDPEEARRFVAETGVDWLSVACGNIHGAISAADRDKEKVQARINTAHLATLRRATGGIPLVLHGGSGIRRESVLDAVREGITKINVGTQVRQVYERALKETGIPAKAERAVALEIASLTRDYFGIEGSADRLATLLLA
jgi:fructose/tagatose bisphosphate aldolase